MSRKPWLVGIAVVAMVAPAAACFGGGVLWRWPLALRASSQTTWPTSMPEAIEIPFDLVNRHVMMNVSVNGSPPLGFVLDTGDRFAIIDLARAKEMGLGLGGEIAVMGAGAHSTTGAFTSGATFTVAGLDGFSQSVILAVPLSPLAPRFGRNVDGVVGADFIKQFILELDYQRRVITLHHKDRYVYMGPGESVPMHLNAESHPVIEAEVTPMGGEPIAAKLVLDIGASGALVLNSPFVAKHRLPGADVKTARGLGGVGTGGRAAGRTGRLSRLRIGRLVLSSPVTFFSEDRAGALASEAVDGSVGQQVIGRCKIFLDYSHERVVLEPIGAFTETFEGISSGLLIQAEGKSYDVFRIDDVLDGAAGYESGLQRNDVIIAVDERPASQWTLTELLEMFERPVVYRVTVQRGGQTVIVSLLPAPL